MNDKFKYPYISNATSPTYQTNTLRSSFQPSTSNNFQAFNPNNTNITQDPNRIPNN
jgi:hypothetical protein